MYSCFFIINQIYTIICTCVVLEALSCIFTVLGALQSPPTLIAASYTAVVLRDTHWQ